MKPTAIEPLFIPYAAHTPQEMVGLLKSIYRHADGDQWSFTRKIAKSEDVRLHTMNHFAIEALYLMTKTIIELEDK
jgi:hypothetical protein